MQLKNNFKYDIIEFTHLFSRYYDGLCIIFAYLSFIGLEKGWKYSETTFYILWIFVFLKILAQTVDAAKTKEYQYLFPLDAFCSGAEAYVSIVLACLAGVIQLLGLNPTVTEIRSLNMQIFTVTLVLVGWATLLITIWIGIRQFQPISWAQFWKRNIILVLIIALISGFFVPLLLITHTPW